MKGLESSSRWYVQQSNSAAAYKLQEACDISPLAAHVLVARGIDTSQEAAAFLHPRLETDWLDPYLIPGMDQAIPIITDALRTKKRIAVFGDFDVDGMSSACLMTLGLRSFASDNQLIQPFIPDRFDEGYGMSEEALKRVMSEFSPDLIVTVDNGIAAKHEVAWLKEQGIEVVVTDHHEPADLVPQGVAVVDPKLDPVCESRELAGAGVALKLIQALGKLFDKPHAWLDLIDLAMLGTVSDMMVLETENRALVAAGIERMRCGLRPGIVALAQSARIDLKALTADSLPFSLVPRLNAAGRMGCTEVAFELLLTQSSEEASVLAERLEAVNQERRDIEAQLVEAALTQAEELKRPRSICVAGQNWHEGVKGIVASRLCNKYHVPSIVFSIEDGLAKGSGRSVGTVDLFQVVSQCSDILERFGGHSGAVGVTIQESRLDEFRDRLEAVMQTLPADQLVDKQEIAAVVPLSDLSIEDIESLEALQPFGQGNKRPLFATRRVLMNNRGSVGQNHDHLRFRATDGIESVDAIMFRAPDIDRALSCESVVDLVFDPVVESWQGRTKSKLMVKDILYYDEAECLKDVCEEEKTIAAPLMGDAWASSVSCTDGHLSSAATNDGRQGVATAHEAAVASTCGGSANTDQQVCETSILQSLQAALHTTSCTDTNPSNYLLTCQDPLPYKFGIKAAQSSASLEPEALAKLNLKEEACALVWYHTSKTRSVDELVLSEPHANCCLNDYRLGVVAGNCLYELDEIAEQIGEELALGIERRAYIEMDNLEGIRTIWIERIANTHITEPITDDVIRQALIGDHRYLPAQQATLEMLQAGKSCLAVMATGRGKSAIFHTHTARLAAQGAASIYVYPLRALVADQAHHLQRTLASLGIESAVLTGETSQADRTEIFSRLAEGSVHIVLTTPEFLAIHAKRFAQTGRIGFVVVDEAHRAGLSRSGARSAYQNFEAVLEELGNPQTLATTATAHSAAAQEICRLLHIDEDNCVIDNTCRENLSVIDRRNTVSKDSVLITTIAQEEKSVIYANSREETVRICRMLRKSLPHLASRIAFYHAGLKRCVRLQIEQAFRNGKLLCIVSTSAFGEGVNIADIRQVILYHMPFGEIEFNQMSGRAGRDGDPASVICLFSERDASLNQKILRSIAPDRSDLVGLYKLLKSNSDVLELSNEELAQQISRFLPQPLFFSSDVSYKRLSNSTISQGLGVFEELGFLEIKGFGESRRIILNDNPQKMQLEHSVRYSEGLHMQEEFACFKQWITTATAKELQARISRPITPSFGTMV